MVKSGPFYEIIPLFSERRRALGDHLTPAELHASSRDELAPERRREILFHLLKGCPSCRAAVGWNREVRERLGVPGQEDAFYDRAVGQSFDHVLQVQKILEEQRRAEREAAAALAAGEDATAVAGGNGLGAYEALLQRSWAVRHDSPQEMVDLARRALGVARGLDPEIYGKRPVADFRARAWGELANAHRVADDLWEAERAFVQAFALLPRGTGDRQLKARLHDLHASLLGTQRRFEDALEALDVVHKLHRQTGDLHAAGRVLAKKAIYLHYSGRSEEALEVNREALTLADASREPKLPTVAIHNQLWFLVACGRYREAKRLLFRNRRRCRSAGRVIALKLLWLEGQIRYGLSELGIAESVFLEVKKRFEEEGLGFAAALASLDVAMVWMRQGRMAEAEKIVLKAAGVFAALNVQREVLAAVALLEEAFRTRRATTLLVERTAALLRDWQNRSEARLEPSLS